MRFRWLEEEETCLLWLLLIHTNRAFLKFSNPYTTPTLVVVLL